MDNGFSSSVEALDRGGQPGYCQGVNLTTPGGVALLRHPATGFYSMCLIFRSKPRLAVLCKPCLALPCSYVGGLLVCGGIQMAQFLSHLNGFCHHGFCRQRVRLCGGLLLLLGLNPLCEKYLCFECLIRKSTPLGAACTAGDSEVRCSTILIVGVLPAAVRIRVIDTPKLPFLCVHCDCHLPSLCVLSCRQSLSGSASAIGFTLWQTSFPVIRSHLLP